MPKPTDHLLPHRNLFNKDERASNNGEQKLARQRFKEANPDLFPNPEPTQLKDPNGKKKKKKKNSKFKRKKSDTNDPNKPNKSSFKKHPLRVDGMKPGESCAIYAGKRIILPRIVPRNLNGKRTRSGFFICLFCRRRGHSLKNCPEKTDESTDKKLCYNCGESGHSLSKCPRPLQDDRGTKYASCFICNETGHLSKNCPKNTHGIYPKGGCCKICGGVTHLAKDCPNKHNRTSDASLDKLGQSFETQERPDRITKFISGDDLEDDFMSTVPLDEKDKDIKPKKKQGTKIVNFVA